jgi:hypothetical protein
LGKKSKIKEFGPQWRTKEHEGKQKIVFSNHLCAPLCAFVVNYPLNFWRIDRLPGTKSLYALALLRIHLDDTHFSGSYHTGGFLPACCPETI